MKKLETFIAYPFFRTPCILYSNKLVLNSKIVHVLLSKMFGNSFRYQLVTSIYVVKILRFFSRKKLYIPNNSISLVYHGYDGDKYFDLDKDLEVKAVYSLKNGEFLKEEFLGYPIFWDIGSNYLTNAREIRLFLIKHLESLKKGWDVLHGDLTPYNVLISLNGEITIIDRKKTVKNSLIFDHFHFYSYLLEKILLSKSKYYTIIKDQLDCVYKDVFNNFDKKFITDEYKCLDISDSTLKNPKFWYEEFGKLIEID